MMTFIHTVHKCALSTKRTKKWEGAKEETKRNEKRAFLFSFFLLIFRIYILCAGCWSIIIIIIMNTAFVKLEY